MFRRLICAMCFAACLVILGLRSFLSMSIILMVRPPRDYSNESEIEIDDDRLEWPREWIPLLFSSPFVGTLVAFVVGFMCFNGAHHEKRTVLASLILASVVTIISPIVADFSFVTFAFLRFLMGVAEGFYFRSVNVIVGSWFPPSERALTIATYTCGIQTACGLAPYLAAVMSEINLSWKVMFYISGAFGLVISALWAVFVTDSPSESRFVGKKELQFISEAMPKANNKSEPPPAVPWRSLLTSPAIHVHLLCIFAINFTVALVASFMPSYLKEEIHLPIAFNGLFTAAPFGVQILAKIIGGVLVDWRKRHGLSHTKAAKICQATGNFGTAISLIAFPFFTSPIPCLVMLLLYGAFSSLAVLGFFTTMTMIAPRFTGTVVAFIMAAGSIAMLSSTLLFTALNYYNFESKFYIIFFVSAGTQVVAGIGYLMKGSADPQPWALDDEDKDKLKAEQKRKLLEG